MSRLTGQDLLDAVAQNPKLRTGDLVRHCGYYRTRQDGSESLNYTGFYKALLEAKGCHFFSDGSLDASGRGRHRRLSHVASVHQTGQVAIGKSYIDQLGLKPGDKLRIVMGRGCLKLAPCKGPSQPEGLGDLLDEDADMAFSGAAPEPEAAGCSLVSFDRATGNPISAADADRVPLAA
jgi:hypothetical protein